MIKYFVGVIVTLGLVFFFLSLMDFGYTGGAITEVIGNENYDCRIICLDSYDRCVKAVEAKKESCLSSLGWWNFLLKFGCDIETNEMTLGCNSLFNECEVGC